MNYHEFVLWINSLITQSISPGGGATVAIIFVLLLVAMGVWTLRSGMIRVYHQFLYFNRCEKQINAVYSHYIPWLCILVISWQGHARVFDISHATGFMDLPADLDAPSIASGV